MRGGGDGPGPGRLLALLAAGVLVVLVLMQLILPRIAAGRIRSKIGRYGKVESVSVSAWPAVRLLWGSAGSVKVTASKLALSPAQAAKLLWEARGVKDMDISATRADVGNLQVASARLRKRGSHLSASAETTRADVQAALPAGFDVSLVKSEGGAVEVQASGGLFGVNATVPAVAGASAGKLVVHPRGFLIEGIQLTLFSDPHVHITGVGAVADGAAYGLTMNATLG
jgi:hypothetical protein